MDHYKFSKSIIFDSYILALNVSSFHVINEEHNYGIKGKHFMDNAL